MKQTKDQKKKKLAKRLMISEAKAESLTIEELMRRSEKRGIPTGMPKKGPQLPKFGKLKRA